MRHRLFSSSTYVIESLTMTRQELGSEEPFPFDCNFIGQLFKNQRGKQLHMP